MSEEIKEEKPKTELDEINEFVEELKQEDPEAKELLDIMKTKAFKTQYQATYRATRQALRDFVDYAKEQQLFSTISTAPGETKKVPDTKKDKIEFVEFAIIKDYSEKSYKLWNKDGLVTYIPKSCVDKKDDNKVYLTSKAKNWYEPEWKEDK